MGSGDNSLESCFLWYDSTAIRCPRKLGKDTIETKCNFKHNDGVREASVKQFGVVSE